MKYPLEKYKFITHNGVDKEGQPVSEIIAISTYAGRAVKGSAKCHPSDTYSIEKGKELAAARCNLKIAEKRQKRAEKKFSEANRQVGEAKAFQTRMKRYLSDSENDVKDAEKALKKILKSM